jgi:hypothetical protein
MDPDPVFFWPSSRIFVPTGLPVKIDVSTSLLGFSGGVTVSFEEQPARYVPKPISMTILQRLFVRNVISYGSKG